jgi:hypothetical protein
MITKVEDLVGPANGENKVFTTPDTFVSGTVRIIWNGNIYFPEDDVRGFSETDTNEITTTNAPRTGDTLQVIYEYNPGSMAYPSDEYADGVQDIPELVAITQAERQDRQIRLVEDENTIYRFDIGASIGGLIPSDVDDGRWFPIGDSLITVIGSPHHPSGLMP